MTRSYKYPHDVYDKTANLLAVLGSWWADQYSGREQMSAVVAAVAEVQQQTSQNLLELLDSLSRHTVPVFHTQNWYELRLSQVAQQQTTEANVLRYNTDATEYDAGEAYDRSPLRKYFNHAIPADLAAVPVLMNRFTDPDLLWSCDTDFTVGAGILTLFADPFEDPRVSKQPVYKDGVIVDQIAVLWVYRGQWDWDTIYEQFGYVVRLRMQSSTGYRDVLNAAYDAVLSGGAGSTLKRILSAVTGIPLVRHSTETVREITTDSSGQLVITDASAYRFSRSAVLTVTVGDTLSRNDSMTTALQVLELNQRPQLTDLAAISLDSGFLAGCMHGAILFPNKEVPLIVSTDASTGLTQVQWPLGGLPLDVDKFFADLHAAGVAAATQPVDNCTVSELVEWPEAGGESRYLRRATMAHLLDKRPVVIGEPTAASLPSTINPCQFLIDNILHKNTTIVILRASGFVDTGTGLHGLQLLRRAMPPHTAVLMIIELEVTMDSLSPTDFEETLETWVGVEVLEDAITTTNIQENGLRARLVIGG